MDSSPLIRESLEIRGREEVTRPVDSAVESALAVSLQDLRRVTEVGLEKLNGSLSLVVQRMDQADQRSNHFNERLEAVMLRTSEIEKRYVTKDELNARSSRIYVIIGLVVTILGPIATVIVSIATR